MDLTIKYSFNRLQTGKEDRKAVFPAVLKRSWIVSSCGLPIGYISCEMLSRAQGKIDLFINDLAVKERYQGKETVYSLLRIAESWGLRLGARQNFVVIDPDDKMTVSFCREAGFNKTEISEQYAGKNLNRLCVVRNLPEQNFLQKTQAELSRILLPFFDPDSRFTGVVLGSGLGWIAEQPGKCIAIPDLPGFEKDNIPGHPGILKFSDDGKFLFIIGRRHLYQGFNGDEIALLPGVLSDLGVDRWILTTSSGAVKTSLETGDLILFRDHIDYSGCVPTDIVSRLPVSLYDDQIRQLAAEISRECENVKLEEGIFACVYGPEYETDGELEFLKKGGISAVSMSTVTEAVLLAGRGCRIGAVATVTNSIKPGISLKHEEVIAAQDIVRDRNKVFFKRFLEGVSMMQDT